MFTNKTVLGSPLTRLHSPTGAVAAALLFFLNVNPPIGPKKSLRQHAREFDFIGLALIVIGIICFLLGLTQSEINGCTSSVFCLTTFIELLSVGDAPQTISLLVVGGILLVLSAIFETYTDRSPIIPPRLFKVYGGCIYICTFGC